MRLVGWLVGWGGTNKWNEFATTYRHDPYFVNKAGESFHSLTNLMREINSKCECKGVIYLQSADWHMMDKYNRMGWSHLNRRKFTRGALTSIVINNDRRHAIVWASPPAMDMVTMSLAPRKPDMYRFHPDVADFWRREDKDVISNFTDYADVVYSEQFEVSDAYMGLTCDGLHFGTSYDRAMYGCGGMSVVTDVMTQLWMHRLSSPMEDPLGIC